MTPEERREALMAERPDAEVVLADERRRTAEEIALRIEAVSSTPLLLHAARIAREVGGSDDQQ